jgi:hypothetical protein
MLIQCRCRSCRRTANYLAVDLLEVFHKDAVIGELWGSCPRCGRVDGWSEQERYPLSDDVGHTVIRRPNGYRKIRLWRNEFYAPPAYGPHKPIES